MISTDKKVILSCDEEEDKRRTQAQVRVRALDVAIAADIVRSFLVSVFSKRPSLRMKFIKTPETCSNQMQDARRWRIFFSVS